MANQVKYSCYFSYNVLIYVNFITNWVYKINSNWYSFLYEPELYYQLYSKLGIMYVHWLQHSVFYVFNTIPPCIHRYLVVIVNISSFEVIKESTKDVLFISKILLTLQNLSYYFWTVQFTFEKSKKILYFETVMTLVFSGVVPRQQLINVTQTIFFLFASHEKATFSSKGAVTRVNFSCSTAILMQV